METTRKTFSEIDRAAIDHFLARRDYGRAPAPPPPHVLWAISTGLLRGTAVFVALTVVWTLGYVVLSTGFVLLDWWVNGGSISLKIPFLP